MSDPLRDHRIAVAQKAAAIIGLGAGVAGDIVDALFPPGAPDGHVGWLYTFQPSRPASDTYHVIHASTTTMESSGWVLGANIDGPTIIGVEPVFRHPQPEPAPEPAKPARKLTARLRFPDPR